MDIGTTVNKSLFPILHTKGLKGFHSVTCHNRDCSCPPLLPFISLKAGTQSETFRFKSFFRLFSKEGFLERFVTTLDRTFVTCRKL